MKHTWTENGHEYFVTDELLHEEKGVGWQHLVKHGAWIDSFPDVPFDTRTFYRRKLETPEEKLIREQREAGYCCFKATVETKQSKGLGWQFLSYNRSFWCDGDKHTGFLKGNIYRKKREDIKADYDALQRKCNEAKEWVTDEWIDDVIGTYNNGGWFFSPYIDNYIVAVKELKQRREQEKDA